MSAPTQDTYGIPHYQAPAPKKRSKFRKFLPAAAAAAALFVGVGIGSAGQPEAPEPVTIQKEVPGPERVVTKTERVEVPVTPPECITALDLAADMVGNLAEVGSLASDGIMAAYNRNGPALDAVTSKVTVLNEKITDGTPAVGAATQACRASAK